MIAEVLEAYADTSMRVFEGREHTIGASEIGQCARQLFWVKKEADPLHAAPRNPDYVDRWGARARGSIFEDHFWLPALRTRYGEKLKYAGADQRTLVSGFLSATPDGLLIDQPADLLASHGVADLGCDRSLVIECKTSDPRTKLDAPKPEHVFQVNTQIGLFQELTGHHPEYALITYTDASFWDEVVEFPRQVRPGGLQKREGSGRSHHDHDGCRNPLARGLDRRRQGMRALPVQPRVRPNANSGAD